MPKKPSESKPTKGPGRPDAGRKTRLSLVSAECREHFREIAAAQGCTIAEAIEYAAKRVAQDLAG